MSIANDNGEPAWAEELASLVLADDAGNENPPAPEPESEPDESTES
jgi:hypothetical protein